MSETTIASRRITSPAQANWGAVWSLALAVICLVTAELLPISLLTPMAADLGVSEGLAGQAVSGTSIVAMFSSLLIAATTRGMDRRLVLLLFTVLFIVSNVLVGTATSFATLLTGRLLLGAAIGGFWSMAAAVAMRLVPEELVPRALSVVMGGVSVAMVVSGPVGTFLGELIGWRWVFRSAAVIGLLLLVWQVLILPSMRPDSHSSLKTLFRLLERPSLGVGILASTLVNGGHFAFFTYLRPFLEQVTKIDANGISVFLLGFGVTNIVSTALSASMVKRSLYWSLAFVPLTMAVLAGLLSVLGGVTILAGIAIAGWGFAFGVVPVAWVTWITRTVPDETESAGGLHVAAIQMSITVGAGLGGYLLDATGPRGVVLGAGGALLIATGLILAGLSPKRRAI